MRKVLLSFSTYQDWVDTFYFRSPSVKSGLIHSSFFLLHRLSLESISSQGQILRDLPNPEATI